MNRANFQQTGGFPLETDTLDFMQSAYDIFNVVADVAGHLSILKGCVVTGGNVGNGLVAINGEVLEFRGGPAGENVVVREDKETRIFEDGSSKEIFGRRYASFGTSGTSYAWVDFKRVDSLVVMMAQIAAKAAQSEVNSLLDRVIILEQIAAPTTGRGRVWWTGTLQQLENECPGWAEDTAWRGRVPMAWNPDVGDMSVVGESGGQNSKRLSSAEQGSFTVRATRERAQGTNDYRSYNTLEFNGTVLPKNESAPNVWGNPITVNLSQASQEFDNRPAYRVGMWIRYVGF